MQSSMKPINCISYSTQNKHSDIGFIRRILEENALNTLTQYEGIRRTLSSICSGVFYKDKSSIIGV